MLKVEIYDNPYNEHQSPGKEITVFPSQFRHPLEVHSPYPAKNVSGIKMVETMVDCFMMLFIRWSLFAK